MYQNRFGSTPGKEQVSENNKPILLNNNYYQTIILSSYFPFIHLKLRLANFSSHIFVSSRTGKGTVLMSANQQAMQDKSKSSNIFKLTSDPKPNPGQCIEIYISSFHCILLLRSSVVHTDVYTSTASKQLKNQPSFLTTLCIG